MLTLHSRILAFELSGAHIATKTQFSSQRLETSNPEINSLGGAGLLTFVFLGVSYAPFEKMFGKDLTSEEDELDVSIGCRL